MEENFLWSAREITVQDILQESFPLKPPLIIQVAGDSETNQKSPCPGEIYRFHAIASHQRAVCESSDGQVYSIPLEYPIKFVKSGGDHETMADLCKHNELPFDVVMETTTNQFKIGDETRTSIDLGQLTVRDVILDKYIKANLIRPGFMSGSVVVFTPTTHCRLRIAEDLDYDQNTLSCSWDEFNRALDSIAKTVDFRKSHHNLDILKFTDSDLVTAAVQRNPRTKKRSSSETERIYADFGASPFATLVRPVSGAGESSIAKSLQKVIKEESVYSRGPCRRGSDSSLPNSLRTYGSDRGLYGAISRSPSVAVVRPSKYTTGNGCTIADLQRMSAEGGYVPMGRLQRGMRRVAKPRTPSVPDRGSVYSEIDQSSMDAEVFIQNETRVLEADQYLTPAAVESYALTPPQSHTPLGCRADRHTVPPPATRLEAVTSLPASPTPPTPPARRPCHITQTSDIPTEVDKLTTADLVDCMILMNLDQYSADFEIEQINGKLLINLSEENLINDFNMKGTHAKKLFLFAKNGWRPK